MLAHDLSRERDRERNIGEYIERESERAFQSEKERGIEGEKERERSAREREGERER